MESRNALMAGVAQQRLEQEQAEFLLRLNAGLFFTLMERAPIGVYVVDDQFRLQQMNAYAAPAFAKIPQPIGLDFAIVMETLWGPVLGAEIVKIFRHTLETGERFVAPQFSHPRHDLAENKSYDWEIQRITLPSGRHGVVCYFADITERVMDQEALRDSDQRIRLATEATGVGVWEWNIKTGVIRWDAQIFKIYGIPPTGSGLMTYEAWRACVLPEDLPQAEAILQETIRTGGYSRREFRIQRPGETEYRFIQAIETVRRDANGEVEWVVGTNLDITERRRSEIELRTAKAAAENASQAKDRFLAALSHELRTPLMPVLMAAETLGADTTLPPDVRDQLRMMERNLELEARLLDDLLDLTAATRGKLNLRAEAFDSHASIRLAVEIVRDEAAAKNIHIESELTARHSGLTADPVRFQQVIWNLLRNAVKFTPPGGQVRIRTLEISREDGKIHLRVEVSDTGRGIERVHLEKIFEPFEQATAAGDHRFGGMGLGLAIARTITDLHGGRIWAESDGPGRGTIFRVEFPGAIMPPRANLGQESHVPVKATELPRGKKSVQRLLLVEDHAPTIQAIARLLTGAGFHVVTSGSVAEALAAAASGHFDLVISDLGLPDGTGIQLMEKLRHQHGLRGIALSGYGMPEDIARTRAAGFVAHLIKPVRSAELTKVLASLND